MSTKGHNPQTGPVALRTDGDEEGMLIWKGDCSCVLGRVLCRVLEVGYLNVQRSKRGEEDIPGPGFQRWEETQLWSLR